MKDLRFHFLMLAIVAAVVVAFFNASSGRGQARDAEKRGSASAVKPILKPIAPTAGESSAGSAPAAAFLKAAALRNALLSTNLDWIFGGKKQTGWYLYTLLIKRLLETNQDADSEGFAAALSNWQDQNGLPVSGVLDDESLYAMISQWQGRRLKDRTVASPDQLITAPVSDFFDPTRPDELRQVEKVTYNAYQRLIRAAIADSSLGLAVDADGKLASSEKYLKIVSSFRSREYQDRLRQQSPNAGSAGLAINSPHFTGRALDLYVGGDPVDTTDSNRALQVQTRVYKWLVRNAESFGFRPYYYEPWHWEYVSNDTAK